MKRKTVIGSAVPLSALLVLVAALAPLAHASVQLTGVLSTGPHVISVDTATIMDEGGGGGVFPTLGWQGDSMAVDTFAFPLMDYGPMQVDLMLTVDGLPATMSIPGPQSGTWYDIPGASGAQVMLSWTTVAGVDEYGRVGRGRALLTVSPSIVRAGATIRAERVAGTNCVFEFYDAAGNRVRTLRTQASSGAASATWTGEDDLGRRLPEGIYYCCLGDAANPSVRKLVLTR